MEISHTLVDDWKAFIENQSFPCVAAKAAMTKQQQKIFVAEHIACPKDDKAILSFIYDFVDDYRNAGNLFHSAVVVFEQPETHSEEEFARLFWMRLQALSDLDSELYDYDERVSPDPDSENFSFSLKGEAFFIIGLHPASSREARRFDRPAIVFNPHEQFEKLREAGQYGKMKNIIRKKDAELQGSINPMLEDFGSKTEAFQYTGQQLGHEWKCPLHIQHDGRNYNKTA